MVKVAVAPGGRLLPAGSSGIVEWVKAEDLDKMQAEADSVQDQQDLQDEAAFDIF
jgi:penicillin-binding protein 1A